MTEKYSGANLPERGSDTFVEAFARGLAVIRAFDGESRGLTLSQVSSKTGLSAAGARRLLYTLVKLGYVSVEHKHFFLGPQILSLGFAYLSSLTLRELAQPLINRFAQQVGEVCSLSVLDGADVVYVARADLRSPLTRSLSIGDRLPVHATSTGHVLMAGLTEPAREAILQQAPFRRFTPKTLCQREELQLAIDKAGAQGWALASEHIELGVCGLAVPVMNLEKQVVAAVTVSANLARHTETQIIDDFLPRLQDIAAQLLHAA